MRFNPTKLLHGLLYTAPITLLTLAACGGGGGSTDAPLDVAYTVSGTTSGLTNDGLVLLNNGGDAQTIASSVAGFAFSPITTGYNVTVLTQPSTLGPPKTHQKCSVVNGSGPKQTMPVTNVTVSCVDAYSIGGTISPSNGGLTGSGLLLQINNGENLQIPANAATFTFSTPLVSGSNWDITLINQPSSQSCNLSGNSGTNISSDISSILVTCSSGSSPKDKYAYVANKYSNTVSPYSINATSGVLTSSGAAEPTGFGPSSVAVDAAGKFAYVTNQTSASVTAYSIASGVLAALPDVDSGTAGTQTSIPTELTPTAIKIHPSGNFAYVVNQGNNSVSAYRLDAASGVARIDSDGGTAGIQTSIPAKSGPISIAIHPEGGYAYVANAVSGDISVFSIDNGISGVGATGTLTAIDANGPIVAGTYPFVNLGIGAIPYSVAVSPDGKHLYVANGAGGVNGVFHYAISAIATTEEGALTSAPTTIPAGTTPRSVAVHPTGLYAYVVNSGSSDISVFDINPVTGVLTAKTDVDAGTPGNQSIIPTGSTPISISIDRSGTFAYVANYGTTGQGNTVSVYQINPSGQLTLMETKTVGTGPSSIATAP